MVVEFVVAFINLAVGIINLNIAERLGNFSMEILWSVYVCSYLGWYSLR